MPDVNTTAEPSTAVVVPEFNPNDQHTWTSEERETWNRKGTVPNRPKAGAEPASASEKKTPPEPKGETTAESGTAPEQERKGKLSAEERVKQAVREKNEAEQRYKELEERLRKLESPPQATAKPEPKTQAQPTKRPVLPDPFESPTPADYKKAMEQYYKDLDAYEQQRDQEAIGKFQREQQQREITRANEQMLKELAEKYPDAETKIRSTAKEIFTAEIPDIVKLRIERSEVRGELLYVLADETTRQKLLSKAKSDPLGANDDLYELERDIRTAMSKPNPDKPPAEKKPSAPPPPKEVGGRGTAPANEGVEAAKANDFKRMSAEMARRHFRAS